ncbi:response regulator [Serpentinicella alkaliphila]|uniref:Stage 0 sporulation protein A homolog n=1 Tax=Serpentinicella alkaliphila TaxID=1734049 RepID=A0A4R2TVG9_9FIRM|nr:response regulator transcription factor [Serpentinicella alkaliphila]TCQ07076.1 LuxR family two component transcriptional regulator [Serpentinicella alkaliphila]
MINILIVDDHPLVRKGLVSILSLEDDINEIKEAANIKEATNLLETYNPQITILDLNLGKEYGLDLISKAKSKTDSKFIIITSSYKKEDFEKAQEIGVDGYILKDAFTEDIIYALSIVKRGKKFIDNEILQQSMKNNKREKEKLDELTSREMEVLEELGKGQSNIEIAQTLYISPYTVKKHVSSILSKLNLHHRTEAALYINSSLKLKRSTII